MRKFLLSQAAIAASSRSAEVPEGPFIVKVTMTGKGSAAPVVTAMDQSKETLWRGVPTEQVKKVMRHQDVAFFYAHMGANKELVLGAMAPRQDW